MSGESAGAKKEKAFKEAREAITKLLKAAADGDLETFTKCLSEQAGADKTSEGAVLTSTKDGNGRMSLHFAALGGKVAIVEHIIGMAADDVELRRSLTNARDQEGETPLVLASRDFTDSSLAVVTALVDKGGADPNIASASGSTALHHAVGAGSTELIEYLLARGAAVDGADDAPMGTPLLHAVMYGRAEAFATLLAHSADVNKAVGQAPPPLHAAAGMGNEEFVRMLLEAGCDLDKRDADGWTALHAAVDGGHKEIADLLRKSGVDIGAVANDGKTAADLAVNAAKPNRHKVLQPVTTPADRPSLDRATLDQVAKLKEAGNAALRDGRIQEALEQYSSAIALNEYNGVLFNNRAAAYLKLGNAAAALADAQQARALAPEWVKAFYREGECYMAMENYGDAAASFWEGLMLDAGNKELKKRFDTALALGKAQHAASSKGEEETADSSSDDDDDEPTPATVFSNSR